MNVGYGNVNHNNNVICPICGDHVYMNKYLTDYCCINKDCFLNKKASVAINEIKNVLFIVNSPKIGE